MRNATHEALSNENEQNMKNTRTLKAIARAILLSACALFSPPAYAHFGMVIPATDIVEQQNETSLNLRIMFAHPFEGESMAMDKPQLFGVFSNGQKTVLSGTLTPMTVKMYADRAPSQAWQTTYRLQRPGDYQFYVQPAPYWEPAEDSFIVHYTKVIVNAFAKEQGWDEPIGLKTEIVPLTRPYGLYRGNLFQGVVMLDGKPLPFAEVEVEYFNRDGTSKAPKAPFITQVTKSDANGVFSYCVPQAGWWGFAALSTDSRTMEHKGVQKPVEIGAVLWIHAYDFK